MSETILDQELSAKGLYPLTSLQGLDFSDGTDFSIADTSHARIRYKHGTGWQQSISGGAWSAFAGGGGTITAASNLGAGQGIFKQLNGSTLEFYTVGAGSSKLSIAAPTSNLIVVDVVEANLVHNNIGGTLSVAKGGTGQTTANAAFAALSPMTANGDMITRSGGVPVRLAVGSEGQALTVVDGAPAWSTGGATRWNALIDPTGDLSLDMGGYQTFLQWGADTSTNDLFYFADSDGNTGTGYLVHIVSGAGSTAKLLRVQRGGSYDALVIGSTGNIGIGSGPGADATVTVVQEAKTSGAPKVWSMTGGAHTGMPASAEIIDIDLALNRTVQLATGAVSTQRAMLVRAPTYGFVGVSTITDAATLAITGAPIAGTNATITNAIALWVQSGGARIGGTLRLDGSSSGYVGLKGAAAAGSTTYTLPSADAGSSGSALTSNADGTLSWSAVSTFWPRLDQVLDPTVGKTFTLPDSALPLRFNTPSFTGGGQAVWISTAGTGTGYSLRVSNTGSSTIWPIFVHGNNQGLLMNPDGVIGIGDTVTLGGALNAQIHVLPKGYATPATNARAIGFLFQNAGHTAMTTGDHRMVWWQLGNSTAQFQTGAIPTLRPFLISAPSFSFVGASTVTDIATLTIEAAPTPGTNATFTNPYAIWVQAGGIRSKGTLRLDAATSGYSAFVPAATTTSVTYTLPDSAPGTNGYVLSCSTAGVMSWAAQSGGGSGTITGGANVGAGETVFVDVSGADLRFNSFGVGSSKISIATASNVINYDVVEANLTISNMGGTLAILHGGTGQTTQTAAFDALSPTTTKGDILVDNGTNVIRLAIGSNGQILSADSTAGSGVKWASVASSGGTITGGASLGGGRPIYSGVNGSNLEFFSLGAGSSKVTVAAAVSSIVNVDIVEANIILSNLGGTLPIAKGGTGQTTQTAAFDALSPTSNKGDLVVDNGTNVVRLAVGVNAQVLTCDSTAAAGVKWADVPVGTVSSGTNLGSTGQGVFLDVVGSVMRFNKIGPGSSKVTVNAAVSNVIPIDLVEANIVINNLSGVLTIAKGGTGQATATLGFNALSPLSAKGDLISRDSTNNVRLPVGSNGQILMADSAQTAGVKWAAYPWSSLTTSTANLALSMANFASTFTWGVATGAGVSAFKLTDTASNTGTGYLFDLVTATSSNLKPFHVQAHSQVVIDTDKDGHLGLVSAPNSSYSVTVGAPMLVNWTDSATNTVVDAMALRHTGDSSAGLGFGSAIMFQATKGGLSGGMLDQARILSKWGSGGPPSGANNSILEFWIHEAGSLELMMTIDDGGVTSPLGFATGDLTMGLDDRYPGEWILREGPDHVYAINKRNKKRFRVLMEELPEDAYFPEQFLPPSLQMPA